MPIIDRPILEIIIRQLARCGFDHLTLAVNHQADLLNAFAREGNASACGPPSGLLARYRPAGRLRKGGARLAEPGGDNRSVEAARMPGMGKPDEAGPVLVTGASGFIGRALAARLEQTGQSVVRVSRAHGFDILRDGLPLDGVRHVFHLAARTGVAESWDEPVAYFDANALGTARVLEQCRRHGCGMTFLSAYVYGPPQRLPIAETEPVEPNNPYALSKSIGEQLCAFYSRFYGLPVVALRAFNVY